MGSYRSSQALVVIDHDSHHSLYLSDETGTYYTLSLEDIVRDNGLTDLEIVRESICTCLCTVLYVPRV